MKAKIAIFCLFVLAMAMLVFAEQPIDRGADAADENTTDVTDTAAPEDTTAEPTLISPAPEETETAAKNMTFGACVSAAATVKNTCYTGVKTVFKSCKDAAINATDKQAKKQGAKDCKATLKKDMKQCKLDFKTTKKNECGIIKHNFLESIGAAFK